MSKPATLPKSWPYHVPARCECGAPNEFAGRQCAPGTRAQSLGGCRRCRTIEDAGYDRGPEAGGPGDGGEFCSQTRRESQASITRNEEIPMGAIAAVARGCAQFWRDRGERPPTVGKIIFGNHDEPALDDGQEPG